MATFISFIGSVLSVSAATPATEDKTGYEALSWTTVGNVETIGAVGDAAEDISFNILAEGRTKHVSGVKDMGDIEVTLAYERADAGLTILEAGNNSNTVHSFRIVDADGDDYYLYGLVASLTTVARDVSTRKGMTFQMRSQSGLTKVDGP